MQCRHSYTLGGPTLTLKDKYIKLKCRLELSKYTQKTLKYINNYCLDGHYI